MSWQIGWDSEEMLTQDMYLLENSEKGESKAKLSSCEQIIYMHSLFQLFQRISSTGRRKLSGRGESLSPRTDNQIKYCYIFCLISTRSSIPPLIKHIILLQKVNLIYAKSDLDILSPAMEIS